MGTASIEGVVQEDGKLSLSDPRQCGMQAKTTRPSGAKAAAVKIEARIRRIYSQGHYKGFTARGSEEIMPVAVCCR